MSSVRISQAKGRRGEHNGLRGSRREWPAWWDTWKPIARQSESWMENIYTVGQRLFRVKQLAESTLAEVTWRLRGKSGRRAQLVRWQGPTV